ncbi:MAG: tyrosine-type recombinase/integrase [Paucibacter sp.]|nr:tyrosine-type recombinase/integrase [Roseateles sp.]
MPTNTLSDLDCRKAQPTDKAQKLFDGGGLHLFISPAGAKTWRVAYRVDGKPQTKSLGPYPTVTLAAARVARDALKTELRQGVDPMAAKRAARAARKGITLKEACDAYWAGRKDISTSYRDAATRALELHLYPALGERAIGSITRDDLLTELRRMDAAGLHEFVRKVRMWVGQVFDWAVEHGDAQINPAALIKPEKAFGKTKVKSFAALRPAEVAPFMQRLALEHDLQSVLGCKLLAYTWVRTTELRMMEWSEIEGDLWRIRGERMKRDEDHLVPLSRQAQEILQVMRARSRGSKYVFPSAQANRLDRPMSENAILYLIARIGYQGRMTGHGWRSVASTWANEAGFNPDAIERQLAHIPDDAVRAVYNRSAYLPLRREMLQAWADWLDAQASVPAGLG